VIERTRREPDPFLDWKVRVFFTGAVLVAAGVFLGQRILVLLAIVVLAVGLMGMTILTARRRRQREQAAAAEDWENEVEEDGEDTRV
jgi:Flp pilus assembly protein TadB